jgi:pyruvate dehydrogenase E1 component alpha subunit
MTKSDKRSQGAPYQVLDPKGRLVRKVSPAIEEKDLLAMYRWMLLTRRYDERCMRLQRQGRLQTFAPCSGQEGSQVGSAYALRSQDWLFPSYREHAASMIHGLPMHYLIALWQGNEEGSRIPEGVNIFTYNIPIASQIPHAVGFSLAAKLQGDDRVSIVYFGDGGTSEGDFHEGLNFAVQVDGMDVLAVYEVTKRAIEKAASGKGPTLIEAVAYRFGPHTTADDPTRYRGESELAEWMAKDPLIRMKAFLVDRGLWDDAREEVLEEEIKAEVARGVDATEELHARHERDVEEIFDYLYEEMTPRLKRQLRSLREEVEGEGR